MVNFDFCGNKSQITCINYFETNKYNYIDNSTYDTYLIGMNRLKSWNVSVIEGVNNITINENEVYNQGSLVLIEPDGENLKLNLLEVNRSQSDYVLKNNVSKLIPEESNKFYRVCLKVLTTRYYYNSTNQTFNVWFNTSGLVKLDLYLYDNNMNFGLNQTLKINVIPSKLFFMKFLEPYMEFSFP